MGLCSGKSRGVNGDVFVGNRGGWVGLCLGEIWGGRVGMCLGIIGGRVERESVQYKRTPSVHGTMM